MARYDYGLRGPRDTPGSRPFRPSPSRGRGPEGGPLHVGMRPVSPRVTAPYNRDYVVDRGPRFPRNPHPYGGEWFGQIADERAYRQPFITRGGSWTNRGTPTPPFRYDYRDFGPDYGGRYPEEL
jgi:hypothetical protein